MVWHPAPLAKLLPVAIEVLFTPAGKFPPHVGICVTLKGCPFLQHPIRQNFVVNNVLGVYKYLLWFLEITTQQPNDSPL